MALNTYFNYFDYSFTDVFFMLYGQHLVFLPTKEHFGLLLIPVHESMYHFEQLL